MREKEEIQTRMNEKILKMEYGSKFCAKMWKMADDGALQRRVLHEWYFNRKLEQVKNEHAALMAQKLRCRKLE